MIYVFNIFYALKDDCIHVSTCKMDKENWDMLCISYEETSEIKQSRLNILLHEYKFFTILPH